MANPAEARQILQAIKDWRHWVGNDMLNILGVPDNSDNRNRDARFLDRMADADMQATNTLLEYFELGPFAYADDVWDKPGFKLFVSHLSTDVPDILPLTEQLNRFGIRTFLAHEAIRPARDWRDTLLQALKSMDGLLSFHSEGFRASDWCSQEVGFALGRDKPLVAVINGELPAGFISAYQGIRWNREQAERVANAVVDSLLARRDSATALANSLARQLRFAGSWDRAGFCIDQLERCGELSDFSKRSIELALRLNDQVIDNQRAPQLIGMEVEEFA